MPLKRIKIVSLLLLTVGLILTTNISGGTSTKTDLAFQKPEQTFHVVVLTPKANQKQTASDKDYRQSARGIPSGIQPLPNYNGETLTLGLLSN